MRRLLVALVVAIVAAWGGDVQAARLETPEDLRGFCDQVMDSLSKLKLDEVGAQIKANTFIPPSEMDAILGRVKLQMPMIVQRFGAPVGYEFIKEERVGQSFIRLTYVQRMERNGLPWHFIFYRAPGGWSVNTFLFVDNPTPLF